MANDQPGSAPPVTVDGVTFRQWITNQSALPGTARYEWRGGAANRLRVGRTAGKLWAAVDGKPVYGHFVLYSQAMRAAVTLGNRRAAA